MKPTRGGSTLGLIAVGSVAIALVVAGCGSSYSCGNGNSGHCYGTVSWSGATQGQGVLAGVVHMNSGDIFVDDEAWVTDTTTTRGTTYWVEIGEIAQGGPESYFWADNRPGSTFFFHSLGPVPNGDFGQNVIYLLEKDEATSTQWDLGIFSPSVSDLRYFVQSTSNTMNAGRDIMGQELAGSSGASADAADFLDAWDIPITPVAKTRTTDGNVLSQNPPQGSWVQHPSPSGIFGGKFETKCC